MADLKAKLILKDKFWIIEDNGVRIGTLSRDNDSFFYSNKGSVSVFQEHQFTKKFGKDFLDDNSSVLDNKDDSKNAIYGYSTKCPPYNATYNIQKRLPLFTKSKKSKSVYCAGYYIIKFNVNWLKSFCPKLITLERNEYIGPFTTEFEMKASLKNVNRTT